MNAISEDSQFGIRLGVANLKLQYLVKSVYCNGSSVRYFMDCPRVHFLWAISFKLFAEVWAGFCLQGRSKGSDSLAMAGPVFSTKKKKFYNEIISSSYRGTFQAKVSQNQSILSWVSVKFSKSSEALPRTPLGTYSPPPPPDPQLEKGCAAHGVSCFARSLAFFSRSSYFTIGQTSFFFVAMALS